MTKDADLKRIVRDRMSATGESYTKAREQVLAEPAPAVENSVQIPPDPFYDKTIRAFFDGERLRSVPTRRRARTAVLVELATRFEPGRDYTEPEVNELLGRAHEDHAWLRRELVEIGYLDRADGVYRRTTSGPQRDANQLQEVPVSEAARLGWA